MQRIDNYNAMNPEQDIGLRQESQMNNSNTDASNDQKPLPGAAVVISACEKKKKVKLTSGKTCSGYNLFYRYNHIVQLSTENEDEIPTYLFGLERVEVESSPMLLMAADEEINEYRKAEIARTLREPDSYEGIFGCNETLEKKRHMSFAELSKYVGRKWQESDETTRAIFKELAQEVNQQRQLMEYQSFSEVAADCLLVTPSSVLSDVHQSTDNLANVKSVASASDVSASHDFNSTPITNDAEYLIDDFAKPLPHYRNQGFGQVIIADWKSITPLPFDCNIDEMDIFEFDCMLSHFDFS